MLTWCHQVGWKLVKTVTLAQCQNETRANVSHVMLGQCHTVNGIFTFYRLISRWPNVGSTFTSRCSIEPTLWLTPISNGFLPYLVRWANVRMCCFASYYHFEWPELKTQIINENTCLYTWKYEHEDTVYKFKQFKFLNFEFLTVAVSISAGVSVGTSSSRPSRTSTITITSISQPELHDVLHFWTSGSRSQFIPPNSCCNRKTNWFLQFNSSCKFT